MHLTRPLFAAVAACCALTHVGCNERDADSTPETTLASRQEGGADDVWISVDRDVLPTLERLGVRAPRVYGLERAGAPAAVRVPREVLPALADAAHEEHGRCGGFMLHDDEADAVQTVDAADLVPYQTASAGYRVDNGAAVTALTSVLREESLLTVLKKLVSYPTRHHASATGLEAARYIQSTWAELAKGRSDATAALITHTRTKQPSPSLTIRGSKYPDEHVILGGHMDSIAMRGNVAPGADDNASGIATLTEIARAVLSTGFVPERTVTFYAYAAEEVGLIGATEIATQAKTKGLKVLGVMQYDMVNYTIAREPYVALIKDNTNAALNTFSETLIRTYLNVPFKYLTCGYGCSDHAAWHARGFPATFPHEALMSEDSSKFIHTATDTLDRSSNAAKHAMLFARFGVAFVAELAKGSVPAAGSTR
ncbi:MAG: M20/M25/M40 family metallo-hydrolase [Polyangiales bacterium]